MGRLLSSSRKDSGFPGRVSIGGEHSVVLSYHTRVSSRTIMEFLNLSYRTPRDPRGTLRIIIYTASARIRGERCNLW